jgi:hypothetical protein
MTYTSTSEHQQSGRRQQRDGARAFLKQLRADNPAADRAGLVRLYLDHVRSLIAGAEEVDTIDELVIDPLREWLAANIAEPAPLLSRGPRQRTPEETAAREAEKAALVAQMESADHQRIEEIVTRRLLEYELVDGRLLGDITGAECRLCGARYGNFFTAVAERVQPRQLVRNGIGELELQALARTHGLIR